jgi:hypothetical protein
VNYDTDRAELQNDGSRSGYLKFLESVLVHVREIEQEAHKLGIKAQSIPRKLGRPGSSRPKLIDEYYWVTVTQRYQPPPTALLALWTDWSR